jgi:hypothetical protein
MGRSKSNGGGRRPRRTLVGHAARAIAYPIRVQARVYRVLRRTAGIVGAIGVAMLVGCAVLARTPAEEWPRTLDPAHLPVYVVLSLSVASLLGWAYVQEAQDRIESRLGRIVSIAVFVVLPLVFALAGLLGPARVAQVGGPAPGHWFWTLARWYGPAVILASLVVFVRTRVLRGKFHGIVFGLLVLPYVVLTAYLVFGLSFGGLDAAHHATMQALGTWAIALQLALTVFVGSRD